MRFLNSFPRLNTIILCLIAWAWIYTEVLEYYEREARVKKYDIVFEEFRKFHGEGGRFTRADGDNLQAQILEVERQLLIHYKIQNSEREAELKQ